MNAPSHHDRRSGHSGATMLVQHVLVAGLAVAVLVLGLGLPLASALPVALVVTCGTMIGMMVWMELRGRGAGGPGAPR